MSSRRGLLIATAGTGAAGVLAACGGSSASGGSSAPSAADPTTTQPPTPAPSAAAPSSAAITGTPLAQTTDIPVGGGKVFNAEKVVVTQPSGGDFKAFTAVCTHMGCLVNKVAGGTISCPCHGSTYSATDGSVTGGPAPRALAAKAIAVSGSTISLE